MKKLAADPEYYALVATAILSTAIVVLDFLGLLDYVPWLAHRIPTLILLVVSSVLGYLIIERRGKLQSIETLVQVSGQELITSLTIGVDRIITALQGTNIRQFERREDMFVYLEERVRNARTIDVTHFGLSAPEKEIPVGERYYNAFATVAREGQVKIRRIVQVSNLDLLAWVRKMIADFAGRPVFIGCYPQASRAVPTMNLIIIDGEEVCLGGGERLPSYEILTISVRHPAFVKLIQEHFDKLWRDSMRLNEGGLRSDLLAQLEQSIHGGPA